MDKQPYVDIDPKLTRIINEADDMHVKIFESDMSLRQFLAAALAYMPGWMRMLYRVRKYFVMLMGGSQEGIPHKEHIVPAQVPFTPGGSAAIFTVICAEENRFWLAQAEDDMIIGYLGVALEPLGAGLHRFHFLSGARFLKRRARLYYAVITPFHHLVIQSMARHALQGHERSKYSGLPG